ncbi:hypothetical protein H8787_06260 [Streptococcus sp. NSJ-72]|uniref:hypothetical protein n=1 Tax=Streptococcus sp. NSJ-72 TaxID=2763068 RepID=UPI0016517848|nr:hypothetical protein [Streptococcus sp. NSJ-72]QNL41676.1 hypothetical protein H8787_06260 [Streptococcus sp. NSJ-72]
MEKILKFLLYLLNRLTNKFNELYEKYENVKRKIDSLENLKIMNSKEYIQVLAIKNIFKYLFLEIFVGFLFIMLLKLNPTFTNSDFLWPTILWPILYLVVLLFLVGSLYYCLTKFFVSLVSLTSFKKNCFFKIIYNLFPELNWLKHYALLVPIVIFSILISLFISILVGKNNYLGIGISVLIATRTMIWILKGIIKSQPSFRFGDYNSSPTTILAILAILIYIFGDVDWERDYIWSLTIIIVTISSYGIEVVIDDLYAEGEQKAQEIFQEQLLSNNPDYEELKKCYDHGGEKYKEKLLSTEKFLEVIVKNELKSLKDVKNYGDYRLYKAFNYKNYLDSQK